MTAEPTIEELRRQAGDIRAEIKRRTIEVRKREHEVLLEKIDVLLEFAPEHDRTSCSDENPANGYVYRGEGGRRGPKCNRCALLRIKKDGYVDDVSVIVSLQIHWTPETGEDLDG